MMNRREAASGLALSALLWASPCRAQAQKPFCCFSWNDGWSRRRSGHTVLAKPAKVGGPSGIPEVVARIEQVLGFEAAVDVYTTQGAEDNAFATLISARRVLVADVNFLKHANRFGDSDWIAIQIIAHEVGHFIAGFDLPPHANELNADYWSGLTMQRLGASKDLSAAAVTTYGDDHDTDTHPNKYTRATIVQQGWEDGAAGRVDYLHCQRCR